MKILLLTQPMERAGGIQRYTATLTQALRDLLGDPYVHSLAMHQAPNRSRNGRSSSGLKLGFVWQAASGAMRWKPDLILCTHLAFGPIAWLIANLRRQPYWIVVHGIEAWGYLPFFKRIALSHADRVIVTSAFSRKQVVKRHHIDSSRILSLPCTLDETLLNVEAAADALCHYVSKDRRVVLTVARMAASERYKGHDVVLRALPSVLAQVRHLTYVIVGAGDDRIRLERLTKQLGLTDHVVFTGEVSDSELAALYQRSEVFVLPARTVLDDRKPKGEGFGIVFLEAMAFGKPVVGPNYGAPSELIRHGENGLLVDPEDATSVSEALVNLLTSPGKASKMGQAGKGWVRRTYSYGSFREELRRMVAQSASDTTATG